MACSALSQTRPAAELSTAAKLEELRQQGYVEGTAPRNEIVTALHDLERMTADKVRAHQEFERLSNEVDAARARVLEMIGA